MRSLTGPWERWEPLEPPTAVTIGVFDGVHLGHRLILSRLEAQGGRSLVLTFDPHPAEVLAPGTHPRLITTVEERLGLLERLGVEVTGVLDLAGIRHLDPDQFVQRVLVDRLGIGALVVGPDFHFGKDRSGDVAYLTRAGADIGFSVEVVDTVEDQGGVVSSSRIRHLIEGGEVGEAARLLGSRYRLTNVVIDGDKRGREIGFPTANLRPPERKVVPGHGVYAALAHVDGMARPAAVNVGVRPTFGAGDLVIEAFILDYQGDLYGSALTVEFVELLRPELRFDDVGALVRQMVQDVARVREILPAPVATRS